MNAPAADFRLATVASCPMHGANDGRGMLAAEDVLVLPMHKRVVVQYATNAAGVRELRLFHGDKEVSFDEPELFTFAEVLARTERFKAVTAIHWGVDLTWARVRSLLGDLVEAGVLQRADDLPAVAPVAEGDRPSPLAPARTTVARDWSDSEAILAELAGRPLEPGWLEMVVPIFRVAHMALDADGRQVGESNAFPPALRLDVPTRWRTCIYAGTRHRVERPMNVTALKAMRAHWIEMMAVLLRVRAAYLARFPEAARGWTVGHLERLAACVLALPSLVVMRRDVPFANGTLHPALSSVFRVTDGLRMTMHQMLFVPLGEPTLAPDTPMTGAEVHAYAERNFSFHSDHGVCAGPQAMIEEFLAVIVDGRLPRDGLPALLDDDVAAALAALDRAMDYGFLGLQVYATVFSLWPAMTRAYDTLATVVAEWSAAGNGAARALDARLADHMARIRRVGFLSIERWRADREHVYDDMHAQCGLGVERGRSSDAKAAGVPLSTLLVPRAEAADAPALATLHAALARRFEVGTNASADDVRRLEAIHGCLAGFLLKTRAVLAVASATQARINTLLDRPQPMRPITAADLDIHHRLVDGPERRLPFLVDEIASVLGLAIEIDAHSIHVRDASSLAATRSAGMSSAGSCAHAAQGKRAISAHSIRADNAQQHSGESR